MSNTRAATPGGRASILAAQTQTAKNFANPPTGPKVFLSQPPSMMGYYAWNQLMNDAANQGWSFYAWTPGAYGHNLVVGQWFEIRGSQIVKARPGATYANVQSQLNNEQKAGTTGVFGESAAVDNAVFAIVATVVTGLVTGPMMQQAFTAASTPASTSAASTVTTAGSANIAPAQLLTTGGGFTAAPAVAVAPTAADAFITAGTTTVNFTAAAAPLVTTVGTATTAALTGSDLVGAALVNAGVSASSLAVVAPTIASSVAAASFQAASTPSLATALDVLAQPAPVMTTPSTPSTSSMPQSSTPQASSAASATPAAPVSPTTPGGFIQNMPVTPTSPSLLTQAGNLLTTLPVDAGTALTLVKTVQQYQQGQAAVNQANAAAAAAQQQAAMTKAAIDAQAAGATQNADPLSNISPGVILAALAAGAALLMS